MLTMCAVGWWEAGQGWGGEETCNREWRLRSS